MGGLSCAVPRNAIMAGATLPVQPANAADVTYVNACAGFDAKLRECYSQSDIVSGIVDADLADTVCPILGKGFWSRQDRETLFNALQSLYVT